ncbi:NAD(+)/NADH kinase [Natronospora cellulosivora (SeqCode)]
MKKLIIAWRGVDFIPAIALVINTQKDKAFKLAEKVIKWLISREMTFYIEKQSAKYMNYEKGYSYRDLKDKADIVIVIGGDGTFLHTAHYFFGTSIPLLGINIGRLGFLTEIETDEIELALESLKSGNYNIEKRMILEAKVINNKKVVYHNFALNDFVIHRSEHARLVSINLFINNETISSYRADGIIIATPTGSTAYSLSAGGPIINPSIRTMIITPICPHNLYIRPMLISDQENITLKVDGDYSMSFTADGSYDYAIKPGDDIYINVAKNELCVVKLPGKTFYSILHEKMKVGLV